MPLRIERGAALPERTHRDALPALVFPLENSVVEVRSGSDAHRLDRACFAVVPARVHWRVRALSPLTKLLTIFVEERAVAAARREYAPYVDAVRFARILSELRVFSRTRWVDELAHRTLFELDVCQKHSSRAARFLETELAKEVYFLGSERLEERTRASVVHEGSDLVARARALIEADLFAPLRIDAIVRKCHTSASTLLRAFRKELGRSPASYVRDRRLDEALLMLEAARWTVSEVANRVGYANLPAFSVAFRRRFGVVPSRARSDSSSIVLPPHGAPPDRRARRTR